MNWANLITALDKEECVLVLGPNVSKIAYKEKLCSLHEVLADHLNNELNKRTKASKPLDTTNFAHVAQQLEEALLPECKNQEGRARARLIEIIQDFYQDYKHTQFPVYSKLANLPFRFIVNTSPDLFLEKAFHFNRKFSARTEFYHYRNPSHNNAIDNSDFESPDPTEPLVFNLFGSIDIPESLVITETDQLEFLKKILNKEKEGIPSNIAIEFTSTKKKDFEKTYIFLGFDFNEWHLRLIIYLINSYEKQKEAIVLQNPKSLSELTAYFYDKNYKVAFVDKAPEHFANELLNAIENREVAPQEEEEKEDSLNAFLMYADADKEVKAVFETQLAALKRNKVIRTWSEEMINAGAVRADVISAQIESADIIILLVTPRFISTDKIYEEQLQRAIDLHRQQKTTVIPILMKSCSWQSTIIKELRSTMLPRKNGKPLMEEDNVDAALNKAVQKLEVWCDTIFQMKKENAGS